MANVEESLSSLVLSASEVGVLTGWPDPMVEDYQNIIRNFILVAQGVDTNSGDVATNETNIATNSSNIAINSTNIASNAADIVSLFAIVNTQYQCFKVGTQATTGAYVTVTGWAEDENVGGFVLNSVNGTIEFTLAGRYEISAWVMAEGVSDRLQLNIKFQVDRGAGFVDLQAAEDRQYAARDVIQDAGSAQVNNYQIRVDALDLIRVQVQDIGVTGDILDDLARINIRRIA